MAVVADNAIAPATANEPPLSAAVIHSEVIHSEAERIAAVNAAVRLGLANLARKTRAARKRAGVDNAPNNANREAKDGLKAEAVTAEVETEAAGIAAVTEVAIVAVTEVASEAVTVVDAVAATIAGKILYREAAGAQQTLRINVARFNQQKIGQSSRDSRKPRAN
ncbi:MAG: hypothetical protein ACKO0N_03450 [Planctomycetota bacterium]